MSSAYTAYSTFFQNSMRNNSGCNDNSSNHSCDNAALQATLVFRGESPSRLLPGYRKRNNETTPVL